MFGITGLVVVLALSLLAVQPASAAGPVQVCHRPYHNADNVYIIPVSPYALARHLAHGDHQSFGGFCYVVQAGDQNATLSEHACQDQFGGHLASIHSLAEDNFISRLVDPDAKGGITARIGGDAPGGFRSGPGAAYAWTDGTPWNYQNWRLSTREPSGSGGPAPASIQFWPNTNGSFYSFWNDTPSGDGLGNFVCKYHP